MNFGRAVTSGVFCAPEGVFASQYQNGDTADVGARAGDGREKPLGGRRILVIEDDFFIGYELAQFLVGLGADVAGPYATTASARDAYRSGDIDGALLDVNLGRETSIPLAKELKADGVPFMFVTAYADENALFEGDLADTPRLGKPVSRAILGRKVSEIFA